jgi:hypothetical protein
VAIILLSFLTNGTTAVPFHKDGKVSLVTLIKAVPLQATKALGGGGGITSTHSRPRH